MIDLGAVYRAVWLVTDDDGDPVNPAAATLTATVGVAAPITVPVTLPPAQQGVLIADHQPASAGLWAYDWATTGPVSRGTDYVSVRRFVALGSLAEAREWLGVNDTGKDGLIRSLMGISTRLTEGVVGTCVIRQFTADWITGTERPVLRLSHGPLPNASSVTVVRSIYSAGQGGPSWTTPDLVVNPAAGTVRLKSGQPFWGGPWTADYTAGRIEVAENIAGGYQEILSDLYAPHRWITGDAELPTAEDVASAEALIPSGYELPKHALEQLEPDRYHTFA
jgi:hypothetical protein